MAKIGIRKMAKISRRVRSTPRMSINKLCEYLVCQKPSRRQTIIVGQKYPQDFIVHRYADALRILPECIEQKFDDTFVAERLRWLETKFVSTAHSMECRRDCVSAIKAGRVLKEMLPFAEASFLAAKADETPSVMVGEVEVSVRPEVFVKVATGKRAGQVGAIKLVFSKTNPLDDEALDFDATLLLFYMKEMFGETNVSREHCIVVDVFARKVVSAPKSFKSRMKEIEAACDEIDCAWPTVAA